jgi:hypothetical protein
MPGPGSERSPPSTRDSAQARTRGFSGGTGAARPWPRVRAGRRPRCQRPGRRVPGPARRFAATTPPGRARRARWPRLYGGPAHRTIRADAPPLPAPGPDQPGQRVAQRAVTDQVGRRWRVPEGECLNEHIGCLVAAQPPGEAHPRPRESRRWPGGQALHRRAPRPRSRPSSRPPRHRPPGRARKPGRPAGPHPGPAACGRPGQDIGWCSLATSSTWAAAGPAPGPPGAHHAGVPPAGPGEPGGQASR